MREGSGRKGWWDRTYWRKLSPQPGYQKCDGRRMALERGFSRHSPKIAHIWNSTMVTSGYVRSIPLFLPPVGEQVGVGVRSGNKVMNGKYLLRNEHEHACVVCLT